MKTIRRSICMLLITTILVTFVGCAQETADNKANTEENSVVAEVQKDTEPSSTPENVDQEQKESAEETEQSGTEDVEVKAESTSNQNNPVGSTGNEEESQAEGNTTEDEESKDTLSEETRTTVNMVNYLRFLACQISVGKRDQLFLEGVYDSFDNINPELVDTETSDQIQNLMDAVHGYRMISVKRNRIEYIFEQAKARAIMAAIPSPSQIFTTIGNGHSAELAKGLANLNPVATVVSMTAFSARNYAFAISEADLAFIKDGWELDDAEADVMHESTKNALSYMFSMVEKYSIPGNYALSEEDIKSFIEKAGKPDEEIEAKIEWLAKNEDRYSFFGPYWLEMTSDYYKIKNYSECLKAISQYEKVSNEKASDEENSYQLFRLDTDYARLLPMAIFSAKQVKSNAEYEEMAKEYCNEILENTGDKDWDLRYFVAQTYIELYAMTKKAGYLKNAYEIVYENVLNLIDEQKALNESYLGKVQEIDISKGMSKLQKEEAKKYNKTVNAERAVALPPVSNALYLNCELLFALAEETEITEEEKTKIERILHPKGDQVFLTKAIDDRFWFKETPAELNSAGISVDFNGESFSIPAVFVSDQSSIIVSVKGDNKTIRLDDWTVEEVKRPKKAQDCAEFTVTYMSKAGDKHKFKAGEVVTISVVPNTAHSEECYVFTYNVVETKKAGVLKSIKFERVEN